MSKIGNFAHALRLRADEVESWGDDPEAISPSGKDFYTAQLLRKAASMLEAQDDKTTDEDVFTL